jgi:hypothetical protein
VPLTKKEIEEKYDYITFPPNVGGGIGEMVPENCIDEMVEFISKYGEDAFDNAVYHSAFGEYAFAYIHPCEEMRGTTQFGVIQSAFISAYC